jgi:hypothetical protein
MIPATIQNFRRPAVSLSASDAYKPKKQELVPVKQGGAVINWEPAVAGSLVQQVEQIRTVTAATPAKTARRLLSFWLRIYVKDEDDTKVNIRIPIPLPLIGALLPRQLSLTQVMEIRNLLLDEGSGSTVAERMNSLMAVEFVHIQDEDTEVIIGLD